MSDLSERLRSIAETLDGCEWNHPLCAASDCRRAAEVLVAMDQGQSVLKAELEESTALQPCGHSSRWLAYRNPVDVTSEQCCLFCEIDRLTAELEESAAEESEACTQVEKFSVENGRLTKEIERLQWEQSAVSGEILQRAAETRNLRAAFQLELADARKAAESLYTSLLAGFSRGKIIRSALEKWPWLGPPEPKMCPHEASRQYTAGVRPEHSSEAPKQWKGET